MDCLRVDPIDSTLPYLKLGSDMDYLGPSALEILFSYRDVNGSPITLISEKPKGLFGNITYI